MIFSLTPMTHKPQSYFHMYILVHKSLWISRKVTRKASILPCASLCMSRLSISSGFCPVALFLSIFSQTAYILVCGWQSQLSFGNTHKKNMDPTHDYKQSATSPFPSLHFSRQALCSHITWSLPHSQLTPAPHFCSALLPDGHSDLISFSFKPHVLFL